MRYSRTKPLRRNAPSQSTALPFCYAWRRQDLHSACAEHYRNGNYETLRTVVDAFQTTQRRLDCTYAVGRIASTPRVQNITITKLFGLSWTPFKQPSRHQRRLDCTRTPSTALRTRQLRVGKPAFLWETQQEQRPVKLRIWYGLFCMSTRALYFLFVLFTSNVVRVLSNSLSLLAYVRKPPLYVVCKMYFTAISLLS